MGSSFSNLKYEPLWVSGAGHSNLKLYLEFIKHLKWFSHTIGKSKVVIINYSKKNSLESKNHAKTSKEFENGTLDASNSIAAIYLSFPTQKLVKKSLIRR